MWLLGLIAMVETTEADVEAKIGEVENISNVEVRESGYTTYIWLSGTRVAIAQCVNVLNNIDADSITVDEGMKASDDVFITIRG